MAKVRELDSRWNLTMNKVFKTYFEARIFKKKERVFSLIRRTMFLTLFTAIKTQIAEKTVALERIIAEQEKAIFDMVERNAELERIISEQKKIISDRELALMGKHTEELKVSPSSHVQSTQTEALPLFPMKPTPPKDGVPRKNGRRHRRHQTYPFFQDGMPSNNYLQRDVGIQTVLPSNPKEGLPFLMIPLKPEPKGRHSSLHNDREPHTPEGLPPIPAGDLESPSFHHSLAGTFNVEIPSISCKFNVQDPFCILAEHV